MEELGVKSEYIPESLKPKGMHLATLDKKRDEIKSVNFELDCLDMQKEFKYHEEFKRLELYSD